MIATQWRTTVLLVFLESLIKKSNEFKNIELEIRTKSTYIKPLMKKSIKNLVIAFSFTPERFSSKYELGVANLKKDCNFKKPSF